MVTNATANRSRMPIVAAVVDEIRAQGISVKVVYASENGITVGTKPEYPNAHDIPATIGRAAHENRRAR